MLITFFSDTVIELCKSGYGIITKEILDDYVLSTANVEEDHHKGTVTLNMDEVSVPKQNLEILQKRSDTVSTSCHTCPIWKC